MSELKVKVEQGPKELAIKKVKKELIKLSPRCDEDDTQTGRYVLLIVNAIAAASEFKQRASDEEEILRKAADEGMRVTIVDGNGVYKDRYVNFDAKMERAATLLVEDPILALKVVDAYLDARAARIEKEVATHLEKERKIHSYRATAQLIKETLTESIAESVKAFSKNKRQ